MAINNISSLPLLSLFLLLLPSTLEALDYYTNCSKSPNYTENSPYQVNLQALLPTLPSQASTTGFYNSSTGQNPNQVYALFLCRADINSKNCSECVYQAQNQIVQQCPSQIRAVIWKDECMVRFSNEPIFRKLEEAPRIVASNPQNLTTNETHLFKQVLNKTMNELVVGMAKSVVKFGTKVSNVTRSQKVYSLGQCTPDLEKKDCEECLRVAIGQLPWMLGGRVLQPSCNVRFEVNPFYGNTVNSSFLLAATTGSLAVNDKKKKSQHIIIAISVPLVLTIFLFFGVYLYFRKQKNQIPPSDLVDIITVESLQFDFKTIQIATNNFSIENKLGEGGFGAVYKGQIQNGQEIAVKRLSTNSGQGIKEFKTEVLLVAKLQHNNLVKLLGFCVHRKEKLLVYEFLPNSSLDKVLLGTNKQSLDWETRYKIITGIARGLLYLHEDSRLRVIHRDLKSSNILLDENMNPKISDFGLARLVGANQTQADTNRIVGTYGYMAPEYAMTGRFSVKSDVYSFGIIILEIVSGHKCNSTIFPFHEESLIQRGWKLWNNEKGLDLVDMRLEENYSNMQVLKCIHIGLLCIQEDANKRPTMAPIVAALNGHHVDLATPTPPQLLTTTTTNACSGASSNTKFSGNSYITEIFPR